MEAHTNHSHCPLRVPAGGEEWEVAELAMEPAVWHSQLFWEAMAQSSVHLVERRSGRDRSLLRQMVKSGLL